MKKVVEGNPELIEEHPTLLGKGALVYTHGDTISSVEILLTPKPEWGIPERFGEHQEYNDSWRDIQDALEEVKEQGFYPRCVDDPEDLVLYVRNFMGSNSLYEETRKPGQQVRLVISPRAIFSMRRVGDPKTDIVLFIPRGDWEIQIIPDTANTYPKLV